MDPSVSPRRLALRQAWRRLHRWLGLSAGAVLALAGLTGAPLVFYVELDAWLHPALVVRSGAPPRPWQDLHRALQEAHPGLADRSWRLEAPLAPGRAVAARCYHAPRPAGRAFAPLLAWLDPSDGRVLRSARWGETLVTWIYDLHYTLQLEEPGKVALAVVGLLTFLSLASGLVLWWPTGGALGRALAVRWRAPASRRVYDLHKWAGLAGLLLLAILSGTGLLLVRPGWFRPALSALSTVREPWRPPPGRAAGSGPLRLTLDDAVRVALARLPGAELRWLETPDGPDGVYRLQVRQPGEPGRRFPRTQVYVDPRTGEVAHLTDPRANSAAETLLDWLHPLHSGEAFGLPGRLLVAIGGLAAAVLFGTGLVRWRQMAGARTRAGRGRRHT